jgi:hypothetical protein
MEKLQLETNHALNELKNSNIPVAVKEILGETLDDVKIYTFLLGIASSYCSTNTLAAARLNDWIEGNKEHYSMIPEAQLRKDIAIGILLSDILPFVTLEYIK